MSPETKKYLIYGVVILAGGAGALWFYRREQASASQQNAANVEAQAANEEQQIEELAYLGTDLNSSGSTVGSVSLPSITTDNTLTNEIASVTGSGSTGGTSSTGSTGSTGSTSTTAPATQPTAPLKVYSGSPLQTAIGNTVSSEALPVS